MPTRLIADASLPYIKGVLEPVADVLYLPSQEITRARIIAERAEGLLIRSVTRCNATLLEGTAIRFIATATAGFDHIDTAYCAAQGIEWHNAPGCNARGVAHWVMCALSLMAVQRRRPLKEESLGIVGVGNVGRNLLQMAEGWVGEILLCDPPRAEQEGAEEFHSLEHLAEHCSLLSFHTPLTREGCYPTYHLINSKLLAHSSPRTIVLNAARGGVADSQALLQALRSGGIESAMLDCWEGEPHIKEELLPFVHHATPHIAGFSAEGKARGSRSVVEDTLRFFGWEGIDLSVIKVPDLEHPFITIPPEHALWLEEVFLQTSDTIRQVEVVLRKNPSLFEAHRVNYPFHREPEAYIAIGGNAHQRAILQRIGFRLET
ncbi:4-phosphoerythronate dehydrogenase [Porphyromonas circumdentaria]|uniref:4-phosphoerythronate dehydrogenase n=1 Tax=Porphyromonas circumdentaria TaxID=29524 RepID=UPI0026DC24AD|nr:4-phosphoerythronate dehydrogenase [Porphyromonas circumdentaria]MDO4722669.1 4-phosphoerythronate dehydrogenase [Porphyromonas circumdentaria]